MTEREEITEKYLFLALEELATHRGTIKISRSLLWRWRHELGQIGFTDLVDLTDFFEEVRRKNRMEREQRLQGESKTKIKLNLRSK